MILGSLIGLLTNPLALALMLFGLSLGTLLGAMPGFGATIGVALLLPFTYGLHPQVALPMLASVYCGALFGGSITAILVGVPGTSANAATILDGFAMTQKGESRKALTLSASASAFGGVFGGLSLLFLAPPLSRVALWFSPAEYFVLAFFGLSIIATVSGESIVKGLIAGLLGIALGLVGIDPITGEERFTFGEMYLLDGFPLIPVILAIFAFPRSLQFLQEAFVAKEKRVHQIGGVGTGAALKLTEFFKMWRVLLRSSILGTIIGIIPAAGGNIACWVGYSEAKRKSNSPEKFGSGMPEGIVGPQAADLSTEGGALIPLLTLGIPGSPPAAVLIGALMIHGLVPGPALFSSSQYAPITYAFMWSVVIASILLWLLGYHGRHLFAKIVNVPTKVLGPIMLFLTLLGSFAARQLVFDMEITVLLGTIFYLLTIAKYPMPPILLGFILGPIAEKGIRRALLISNDDWSIFFTRPICLVLIVLSILSLYAGLKIMRQVRGRVTVATAQG